MFGIIRSGMATAMHEISVVSNNIANAGSTAFKKSDVSFADVYGMSSPTSSSKNKAGYGSLTANTRRNDGQGGITNRDGVLNMALIGQGYFNVAPPALGGGASNVVNFSRNGEFSLDKQGFITASDGSFLLGADVGIVPDDLGALRAIQVPFSSNDQNLSGLEIREDGSVFATYGNNDVQAVGQIVLSTFPNEGGLRNLGASRFMMTNDSGNPRLGTAGTEGVGNLQSGALESSNVDITQEMTVMMRAQQQFSGSARLLQTNSEMVDKLTR